MPNPRWWDFESGATDFGAIIRRPARPREAPVRRLPAAARHDWSLAPLDVPTGSLCWIDSLTVTDVFAVNRGDPAADAAARHALDVLLDDSAPTARLAVPVVPTERRRGRCSRAPLGDSPPAARRDRRHGLGCGARRRGPYPARSVRRRAAAGGCRRRRADPARLQAGEHAAAANWFPLLPVPARDRDGARGRHGRGQPRAAAGRLVKRLIRHQASGSGTSSAGPPAPAARGVAHAARRRHGAALARAAGRSVPARPQAAFATTRPAEDVSSGEHGSDASSMARRLGSQKGRLGLAAECCPCRQPFLRGRKTRRFDGELGESAPRPLTLS